MAKSQETFRKKEKTKKRLQKRKEKELKREDKRAAGPEKSSKLEDMFAYVDEFGNLTTTPPDPTRKKEVIKAEDIAVSVPKSINLADSELVHTGKVTFFNEEKGYGFIDDNDSGERIFLHVNELSEPVSINDRVEYKITSTPKGYQAESVKKL